MFRSRILAIVLIVAAGGCAHNAPPPATPNTVGTASRGSDVISAAELASPSVAGGNALEAVRHLRPRYLATRGSGSIRTPGAGSVQVSMDGGPLQAVATLARMRPGEIAEIRYLNASDATLRFGTSAGTGAVLLIKSK